MSLQNLYSEEKVEEVSIVEFSYEDMPIENIVYLANLYLLDIMNGDSSKLEEGDGILEELEKRLNLGVSNEYQGSRNIMFNDIKLATVYVDSNNIKHLVTILKWHITKQQDNK